MKIYIIVGSINACQILTVRPVGRPLENNLKLDTSDKVSNLLFLLREEALASSPNVGGESL